MWNSEESHSSFDSIFTQKNLNKLLKLLSPQVDPNYAENCELRDLEPKYDLQSQTELYFNDTKDAIEKERNCKVLSHEAISVNISNKPNDKKNTLSKTNERQGLLMINPLEKKTPKYEIVYSNSASLKDIYCNLSSKMTPSAQLNAALIKIFLKEDALPEINIELWENYLKVTTVKHLLDIELPYKVKSEEGEAIWKRMENLLEIKVPLCEE